ncbi:hypothetical protein Asppvi_010422 [Aspergillus pseudoviridinutans]|uniref:chitinase n=1 Tax=Aspergillus pseudoviridinutans TaxID=1517512 RepID=A0A9P3BHN5_9EURO|nr:uncharacterized protein Asppvi_010422 [Aspergillus pseudoviridinutans]GIJ91456.1 hypothetical protein Asppvi_010422 [Aspergillus pseudoviridinutans]
MDLRRSSALWAITKGGPESHLNYAFGTIDPATFEVKLASREEESLIKRLARLKQQDPDLKVFIALGGWSYNDPGPTRTTFSDLAASDDAQKKFFKSLISFLSTYNLDGVDLDWEYPGPDDSVERGGREQDFKNFPKFLRQLKQVLKSSGGRDGLTITLPASYWFLQHFDIVELEKHVDFFNIMTYDLHGAWDKGNKWLGNFLNAHTNLTEIQDAMDLLWRNNIPSKKVVMGTAFYGRAFTATSTACLEPGCTFESAANMGICSRENGILLNSEIMDIIDEKQLTPKLYKDAAVKVIHWENQWVAYDDEETLELKAQFALGQDLGGLMVWAVSHDMPNGRFSNSFYQRTVNRHGMTSKRRSNSSEYIQVKKTIDQCKWTNCGQMCPTGYQAVLRTDKNRHNKEELMLDTTACDGNLHTLCCPEASMPTCGWYTHSNSRCDYTCPEGMVEVGSTQGGCHKGYQAACCTVKATNSMDAWNSCVWAGESDKCQASCPILQKFPQVFSASGSGAVRCNKNEARGYCCFDDEDNKWTDGEWHKFDGLFVQNTDKPDRCSSDCPSDMYRLAMQNEGVCKNKPGAMSWCAYNGRYDTEWQERQNVTDLKSALNQYFQSPTCPNDQSGGLSTRAETSNAKAREQTQKVLLAILSAAYYNSDLITSYISWWNDAVKDNYPNLQFPGFKSELEAQTENIYEDSLDELADDILCYPESYNDLANSRPILGCNLVDECTDGESDCSNEEWDEKCNEFPSLEKRGPSRSYCFLYNNQIGGSGQTTIRSSEYDSINEVPARSDIRLRGVVYRNRADCANSDLRVVYIAQDSYNGRRMHVEHIPELFTEGLFLSDISYGRLDGNTPNAFTPVPAGFVADAWMNRPNVNAAIWGPPIGGRDTSTPSERIFEAYGSTDNVDCFFLLDHYLNFMKHRVWNWRRWNRGPLADSSMQRHITNMADPDQALSRLRSVISVFRYLDAEEVRRCLVFQYHDIVNERWTCNRAWNAANPTQTFDIRPISRMWMLNHIAGMIRTSTDFMNRWLDAMETHWQGVTGPLAVRVQQDIQRLRAQVRNGAINIRLDGF